MKHDWDKGFVFRGRVLQHTIKCIRCGKDLVPSPMPKDWRDHIEEYKQREDCHGVRTIPNR